MKQIAIEITRRDRSQRDFEIHSCQTAAELVGATPLESEAVARLVDDEAAIIELDRHRTVASSSPNLDPLIRLTWTTEDGLDLGHRHARLDAVEVFERHRIGAARQCKAQKSNDQQTRESHGEP